MPATSARNRPLARYKRRSKKVYKSKSACCSVSAVKRVVQRMAETKASITVGTEVSTNSLTSPTTSHVIALNSLVFGTQSYARIGTRIRPRYLNVRGAVHANSEPNQIVKIMVVEHDVAADPLTELLENNSGDIAPASADFSATYARANTTKFRVLATKNLRLSYASAYWVTREFNLNMKLSGTMHYDLGETVPAKRQISLIWFNRQSNNDETTGVNVEMTYNAKFYYQDM